MRLDIELYSRHRGQLSEKSSQIAQMLYNHNLLCNVFIKCGVE